jgi:hypothetical protein
MKLKHLILSAFLIAGTAHADNEMAYTPNKAGGSIFFTFSNCVYVNTGQRVADQYYVYSTDSGGNKGLDGCYTYKYPFYFVEWNGGGRLSVNVNSVIPLKK